MDKQIVIKDLLISYWEIKKESGTTLLFLHGWRSRKEIWQGIWSKIKDRGLTIMALDLPGFGSSESPHKAMTVGDYAGIVAEFIKKLDLKNVIVVGHSFGGRIGIKLAATHPELISRLVLAGSAGFAIQPARKNIYRALAKIAKPFFKPKFMHGLREKIYKGIGAEDYVATPELRQTFVNIVGEDLTEDMKNITCPTLIISGENDADTPISFGKKMNFLIRNSKFIILQNAGHFSFLDQPEEFERVLSDFIN